MVQPRKIKITESIDALAALLENERDHKRYQKLRFLYLLKTGQATNLCNAARILGENTSTVGWEWWNAYYEGGLSTLLEDKRVGNLRKISPEIVGAVIENFKHASFTRSVVVREWILKTFKLLVSSGQIRTLIIGHLLPLWLANQQQAIMLPVDRDRINPDLWEQFAKWKSKQGIPSDSAAMEQLIAEFFKMRQPQTTLVEAGQVLLQCLDEQTCLPTHPYNIPEFLIQRGLVKRLKTSVNAIRENRSRRTFPLWSKQRDPDSIAWVWEPETRRFRAILSDEDARRLL